MVPQQISVQELAEKLANHQEFLLLDVRNLDEYQAFNLGGVLIPLNELSSRLNELPLEKPIVVYCHSGGRSQKAMEFLHANGFAQVSNLVGGILAWQQAGLSR